MNICFHYILVSSRNMMTHSIEETRGSTDDKSVGVGRKTGYLVKKSRYHVGDHSQKRGIINDGQTDRSNHLRVNWFEQFNFIKVIANTKRSGEDDISDFETRSRVSQCVLSLILASSLTDDFTHRSFFFITAQRHVLPTPTLHFTRSRVFHHT